MTRKFFYTFSIIIAGSLIFSLFFQHKGLKPASDLNLPGLRNPAKQSEANKFPQFNFDFSTNFQKKTPDKLDISDTSTEKKQLIEDDHFNLNLRLAYSPKKIVPPSPFSQPKTDFKTVAPANSRLTGFIDSNLANGSVNVPTNYQFSVFFDNIPSQAVIDSLRFYPSAEFTYTRNLDMLTIRPKRLQRSTEYVFGWKLNSICTTGLPQNCNSKDETWVYAIRFRTDYKDSLIYGKSVDGKDLVAYFYGTNNSKGKKIMLTGAIHGEEWRSGGLWKLVDYLNQNPQEIVGKNKTFIIIPRVNPDGAALERRYNSRGVNLNRNWPAAWKSCLRCGSGPASEPETYHLRNLKLAEKPNFLISYHAQWPPYGIIFLGSSENPTTRWFSRWVADRTGYPVGIYDGPEVEETEDVPGDQTVWAETIGIRSIIIEATYRQNDDWNKNFPMYKALLRDF